MAEVSTARFAEVLVEVTGTLVDEFDLIDFLQMLTERIAVLTVAEDDLDLALGRWPRFAARAVADGYLSVHALPLRVRNEVIGAVGVFGHGRGGVAEADALVARALAGVATIGLLQERTVRQTEVLGAQLEAALESRVVVEQATGAIAQRLRIGADEAFEMMREYAHSHRQRLTDVARTMMSGLDTLPAVHGSD
jgi:hypothetical protein